MRSFITRMNIVSLEDHSSWFVRARYIGFEQIYPRTSAGQMGSVARRG